MVFTQWSQPPASKSGCVIVTNTLPDSFTCVLGVQIWFDYHNKFTDCISDCVLRMDRNNSHVINPDLKYVGRMKAAAAVVCS